MAGKLEAGRTYNFTMVAHPESYPRNRVEDMHGDFVAEKGDTAVDAQQRIVAEYFGKQDVQVLSFSYHEA